jgi:hypothetical protein
MVFIPCAMLQAPCGTEGASPWERAPAAINIYHVDGLCYSFAMKTDRHRLSDRKKKEIFERLEQCLQSEMSGLLAENPGPDRKNG